MEHTALLPSRHYKLFDHTSNHCASQVSHSLLGQESAHTLKWSALPKDTTAAETHTRGFLIQSRRLQPSCHDALYVSGIHSDIGTLGVVTARELSVLSGSCTSHSKSMRRHRHLRDHGSHKRYTVSRNSIGLLLLKIENYQVFTSTTQFREHPLHVLNAGPHTLPRLSLYSRVRPSSLAQWLINSIQFNSIQ